MEAAKSKEKNAEDKARDLEALNNLAGEQKANLVKEVESLSTKL